MKIESDQGFLKNLSKAVSSKLNIIAPLGGIRINLEEPKETDTDGWTVKLGSINGYLIEIWFDKFTAYPKRKVYYGIRSKKELSTIIQLARKKTGKPFFIDDKNCESKQDYILLKKRLTKAQFGHPVYEQYPKESRFFYGIYEYDRVGIVERIEKFYQTLAQLFYDNYQTVENSQKIISHIYRERDRFVTAYRKRKDNYICQICNFDSFSAYGLLGKDVADAHHLVPLSSNSKLRITTPEDLVTVCANCHRILHRMSGKPKDVYNLKNIIKKLRGEKKRNRG